MVLNFIFLQTLVINHWWNNLVYYSTPLILSPYVSMLWILVQDLFLLLMLHTLKNTHFGGINSLFNWDSCLYFFKNQCVPDPFDHLVPYINLILNYLIFFKTIPLSYLMKLVEWRNNYTQDNLRVDNAWSKRGNLNIVACAHNIYKVVLCTK